MSPFRRAGWAGLLALLFAPQVLAEGTPGPKRLIEFGWDEPGTRFLREHLAEMEKTPFDGCVFHVDYRDGTGQTGSFTWSAWSRRAFAPEDLAAAREDLRALRPERFRSNFLRFNTTPADLDWFDDFAPILTNARLAAALLREGPCAGILFDIEQYEKPLFSYRKQRDAGAKSWGAYAAQCRRRGREVMDAFQQGYGKAGLTVLLTFGHSLPWAQSDRGRKPLADVDYGLLAPFLDGMIEAAKEGTRIVDGYELSYGYKDQAAFTDGLRVMREGVLAIVADREGYRKTVRAGFGVWLDLDWRNKGWNVEDPTKNPFTPEGFERSVRAALELSDEYVWIYGETPRWWSAAGPVKLPKAYDDALRRARERR